MSQSLCISDSPILLSCIVGVGPASIMVGNLVAGKRMAQAAGRELGVVEEEGLVRKVRPH